jgi:hypothetical protein
MFLLLLCFEWATYGLLTQLKTFGPDRSRPAAPVIGVLTCIAAETAAKAAMMAALKCILSVLDGLQGMVFNVD